MPIRPGPPADGLEHELDEVRDRARALMALLGEGSRVNAALPADFPLEPLTQIAITLANLPAGTGEGCRPVLVHARMRLPAIRSQHFPVGPKAEAIPLGEGPPTPLRGGTLDKALSDLIASVTTALDQYRRIAAETRAEIEEPEQGITPRDRNSVAGAIKETSKLEAKLEEMQEVVAETTQPGSQKADLLKRQLVDAENINREARAELGMKRIVVGWLRELRSALSKTPTAIRKTVDGMRVVVDIAEIGHEGWHNFWGAVWGAGFSETRKALDAIEKVLVSLERAKGQSGIRDAARVLAPGERFRDFDAAPEMVVVPDGKFKMGSPKGQAEERPQHVITIKSSFAVSIAPIARGEFADFITASKYKIESGAFVRKNDGNWGEDPSKSWRDPGFKQDDDHPVVCVNWHDAQAYVAWLRERSGGRAYRLLSEAEWEYCCRAGTTTAYSSGKNISDAHANFGLSSNGTTSVTTFPPNPWGLRDMYGNVWEWREDSWHSSYKGAPADGSVWPGGDTSSRVLRGGSWDDDPRNLRSACRSGVRPGIRNSYFGFRIARTL